MPLIQQQITEQPRFINTYTKTALLYFFSLFKSTIGIYGIQLATYKVNIHFLKTKWSI